VSVLLIEGAHAGRRCLLVYLVHICLVEVLRDILSIEAWLTHVKDATRCEIGRLIAVWDVRDGGRSHGGRN
jgi:hypothetical protein